MADPIAIRFLQPRPPYNTGEVAGLCRCKRLYSSNLARPSAPPMLASTCRRRLPVRAAPTPAASEVGEMAIAGSETLRAIITVEDRTAVAALHAINQRFAAFGAPLRRISGGLKEIGEEAGLARLGEHAKGAFEHLHRLHGAVTSILAPLGALSALFQRRRHCRGDQIDRRIWRAFAACFPRDRPVARPGSAASNMRQGWPMSTQRRPIRGSSI